MKRKVIQIAGKTYVVSLPLDWIRKHNIEKGDDLHLEVEGPNAHISIDKPREKRKLGKINVRNSALLAQRGIAAMYKRGYDEIEVEYENKNELQEIKRGLKESCIAFEIIKQQDNQCTIKTLSSDESQEFFPVYRRMIRLLAQAAKELVDALKEKDRAKMQEIEEYEKKNNHLTQFLRRTILRKQNIRPEDCLNYTIIELAEALADSFKHICRHYSTHDAEESTVETFNVFTETLQIYSEILFSFDQEKALHFLAQRKTIVEQTLPLLRKKDAFLAHQTLVATELLFKMSGPLFTRDL